MEKEFLPYELALELRKLGFDDHVFAFYWTDTKQLILDSPNYLGKHNGVHLQAPLWQQAFDWFREKYKLHLTITSISQESWQWHITKPGESLGKLYEEDFYTYEDAEIGGLKKLIEIVKEK